MPDDRPRDLLRALLAERWQIEAFESQRLVEVGDEVVVTTRAGRPTAAGFATPRCSPSKGTRSADTRSTSAGT
jgi:hypothetical protein